MADQTVSFYAQSARKREFTAVKNYVEKLAQNGEWSSIDSFMTGIVEHLYDYNLGNFTLVVNLIESLAWYSPQATGYKTLFNAMKRNSHTDTSEFIRLAFKVKQTMDLVFSSSRADINVTNSFTNLKNAFPTSIQGLIWNKVCQLKNTTHGEYLYTAVYTTGSFNRVFTWRPRTRVQEDSWIFESGDQGCTFSMQNTHYRTYLGSSSDEYKDDDRLHVYGSSSTSSLCTNWTLEPVNGATSFTIKNSYLGMYLYAANNSFAYDTDRRSVFLWRPRERVTQGYWRIES